MSYAGPSRARGSRRTANAASAAGRPTPGARAPRSSATDGAETDWERVALFGAGIALGIAVGAGAALLAAPTTGAETRAAISRRAQRLSRKTSRRSRDAWADLRDELRNARLSLRRRKVQRARRRELEREELGTISGDRGRVG
ncbi:MAG: YtxH domain-containing protein [Gemmatimonadaceae bacterium]